MTTIVSSREGWHGQGMAMNLGTSSPGISTGKLSPLLCFSSCTHKKRRNCNCDKNVGSSCVSVRREMWMVGYRGGLGLGVGGSRVGLTEGA